MIYRMFAVKDSVAGEFHTPFCAANEGMALRVLRDVLREPNHPFSMHTGDFAVFEVGAFDGATGEVAGGNPRHICALVDLSTTGAVQ